MRYIALLVTFSVLLANGCAGTPTQDPGTLTELSVQKTRDATRSHAGSELTVATLNVAHGRGESLNQLLVSREDTLTNLAAIGNFLQQHEVDVAALQEADAPSWWSGNIEHTAHIAEHGDFAYWAQASHASLGVADYGTALLSTVPIKVAASLNFSPSPPTAQKGFTVAELHWQQEDGSEVVLDVVSIHMDFSRKSVRQQQLAELDQALQRRHNPLILMGDFNSETLAAQLMQSAADNRRRLHTISPAGLDLSTYKDKRLDWIIISGELEFVDYRTETTVLSDHHAVIATVTLKKQQPGIDP
jgi:endonuclease/exonuclease/phosphatase family metal-dependent hydrolase